MNRLIPVALATLLAMPASAAPGRGVIPQAPGGRRPDVPRVARIPPVPATEWSDEQKAAIGKYASVRAGSAMATLVRIPSLLDGIVPFHDYVTRDSSLEPRRRELLILRTAWLTNNANLWAEHAAQARAAGIGQDALRDIALGGEAARWSPLERRLISLADELIRNSSVSASTWQPLSGELDALGALDAVMTVTEFTSLALIYNTLGIQPDSGSAADRLPVDIPYRVTVGPREPALKQPRIEPVPGNGLAITRTFQKFPKMAGPRSTGSNYVNSRSTLPPRYRELLILRTGWDCQAEYEWGQHVGRVGRGREMGLPIERIAEGPDAAGWTPVERALLQAADELYSDSVITDATWHVLAATFDTTSLMNIVVTAANYRMVSMALNAIGVQLDPGDEGFPQ